jgi:hypothetical protein
MVGYLSAAEIRAGIFLVTSAIVVLGYDGI